MKTYVFRVVVEPEVVLMGDDVDGELAKFARRRQVELFAMSTHGRTGLAMGSHTGDMLRQQIAPMMIVRPMASTRRGRLPARKSQMVNEITEIGSLIEVMYLVHKALRAEAERA